MANWSLNQGASGLLAGSAIASTSRRVAVVGSGTANTKGAWTDVIASGWTGGPATLLVVSIGATSTAVTDTSSLLDIGIGSTGDAVDATIIADLAAGWVNVYGSTWQFPLYIPSGVRIAARAASVITSKSVPVAMWVFGGEPMAGTPVFAAVDTYGAVTASSKGTDVVNAGLNTEGAWAVLDASTANRIDAIAIGIQGAADTTMGSADFLIDVGYGAAASETSLIPDYFQGRVATTEELRLTVPQPILLSSPVPAGSRLVARMQMATGTQNLDVIAYGLRR